VFCEALGYGYAYGPDAKRNYSKPLYIDELLPRLISSELSVADVDGRMVSAPTGDIGGRMVSIPTDGAALDGRMVSAPTGESAIVGADIIRPQTDVAAK
jgi:hypothetical protein